MEETPEIDESVNISVSVKAEENGDPVVGATVQIGANNQVIASGTTGSAGGCTLHDVPFGNYTIAVTTTENAVYIERMTIDADSSSLVLILSEMQVYEESIADP